MAEQEPIYDETARRIARKVPVLFTMYSGLDFLQRSDSTIHGLAACLPALIEYTKKIGAIEPMENVRSTFGMRGI